uniref:Uncharacterized protein n=1 Tax=viral metagenome TaxID=1070528 RepID=A0A6C0CZY1_9ZZZZ
MKKCKPNTMKYTGYLHIISLLFAFFGIYMQIYSLYNDEKDSIWLSLSLCIMLLLRIPNQVCLSLIHPHGWLNVIGTLIGALGFAFVSYLTHLKNKDIH